MGRGPLIHGGVHAPAWHGARSQSTKLNEDTGATGAATAA